MKNKIAFFALNLCVISTLVASEHFAKSTDPKTMSDTVIKVAALVGTTTVNEADKLAIHTGEEVEDHSDGEGEDTVVIIETPTQFDDAQCMVVSRHPFDVAKEYGLPETNAGMEQALLNTTHGKKCTVSGNPFELTYRHGSSYEASCTTPE